MGIALLSWYLCINTEIKTSKLLSEISKNKMFIANPLQIQNDSTYWIHFKIPYQSSNNWKAVFFSWASCFFNFQPIVASGKPFFSLWYLLFPCYPIYIRKVLKWDKCLWMFSIDTVIMGYIVWQIVKKKKDTKTAVAMSLGTSDHLSAEVMHSWTSSS